MAKKPDTVYPNTVYIDAPCKINLHLDIGETRPDGFHELKSLFACLAFSDSLKIECTGKSGECLLATDLDPDFGFESMELISPVDNLVYKAVSLFRRWTGYNDGLKVTLKKRIPAGAGLGGGSSDAASTLLALNFLTGNLASAEELMEMAAVLGSDVPFFLTGGFAYVSGRGERVQPIAFAEGGFPAGLFIVMVKPPFSIETSSAYRLLDQARESGTGTNRETLSKEVLLSSLGEYPGNWPFYNDFMSIDDNGVLKGVLRDLREAGASFAGLSGTGPCCFGIFDEKETKEAAQETVKRLARQGNFARLTFFLANRVNPIVE